MRRRAPRGSWVAQRHDKVSTAVKGSQASSGHIHQANGHTSSLTGVVVDRRAATGRPPTGEDGRPVATM